MMQASSCERYQQTISVQSISEYYCSNSDMSRYSRSDFQSSYDEPFGDSSAIPTHLISKIAKEHVSVALSGDGR